MRDDSFSAAGSAALPPVPCVHLAHDLGRDAGFHACLHAFEALAGARDREALPSYSSERIWRIISTSWRW